MHHFTRAADRTRSRRWRAGTRRNKRYRDHTTIQCSGPAYCLVHAVIAYPKRPAAMAMRLTKCEQKWVDDITANRPHVHIRLRRSSVRRSNSIALMNVVRLTARKDETLNIQVYGESHVSHSYHVPPGGVVAAMDFGYPNQFNIVGLGRSWGKAAAAEDLAARQRAMGYDVVDYGSYRTASSPRMRDR